MNTLLPKQCLRLASCTLFPSQPSRSRVSRVVLIHASRNISDASSSTPTKSAFTSLYRRPAFKAQQPGHASNSAGEQGRGMGPSSWAGILGPAPDVNANERWTMNDINKNWVKKGEQKNVDIVNANNQYSGRTVMVSFEDNGVQTAWSKLTTILRRNNVFADFRRNERHEKKGYKRRRLESERWRRRFAHEVRNKVELVKAIRRRGA